MIKEIQRTGSFFPLFLREADYRFCPKGSLHFLHALASELLICKHAGQTKTFSIVLEVSPEEKTAIPAIAIPTPAK
jgi:hypothetical protein